MFKIKECKKFMKMCSKCKHIKLIKNNFNKNKNKKDGYNQECLKYRNSRYEHKCINCGIIFRSGKKGTKFCSRKCMGKYNTTKKEVVCSNCGKSFIKQGSLIQKHNHHFCSIKCCGEWQKKRIIKICDYCGIEYETTPSKANLHPNHNFCSMSCSNKFNAKKGEDNPNYNPNLTDEEREIKRNYLGYREFVKSVFERDKYTCQLSGQIGRKLVVHHLNSYHWDKEHRTDLDNGITITEEIHKLFHKIYGKKNNTKEQFEKFKIRYQNGEFKEVI